MTDTNAGQFRHVDGTRYHQSPRDTANEDAAAAVLEHQWHCVLHRFPFLCPLDWYAERDGRTVAVVELKTLTVPTTRYPHALLSLRKWLALSHVGVGLDVAAMFVAKYTDETRFIEIGDIPTRRVDYGGRATNREPIIRVPLESMTIIREQ